MTRALRPRAGRWVRRLSLGGLRCVMCDRFETSGWAFMDAGQDTTASAFVCDGCAEATSC